MVHNDCGESEGTPDRQTNLVFIPPVHLRVSGERAVLISLDKAKAVNMTLWAGSVRQVVDGVL